MDSLGKLPSVFARKCTVRRIDRKTAAVFLDANHRMGDTTARFRYGLFGIRPGCTEEELLAVATFSNGRTMRDGTRSFEWIRFASLEGIRVVGGMGKLLEAFAGEMHPDDVMTYVDTAVSQGDSYRELGFTDEGCVSGNGYTNLKLRKRF